MMTPVSVEELSDPVSEADSTGEDGFVASDALDGVSDSDAEAFDVAEADVDELSAFFFFGSLSTNFPSTIHTPS